jgi:hypothetical protein
MHTGHAHAEDDKEERHRRKRAELMDEDRPMDP